MCALMRLATAISILTIMSLAAGPTSAALLFVSPFGDDATGDGSPTAPFKTLQAAHNAAAGDDTIMLEMAGSFGPIVINRSINIQGVPGAGIFDPPGPCVTVNAPGKTVIIDNVTCDQSGDAQHGILINTAHKVNVTNSTIRGGTGAKCGIFAQPNANSELNVIDTTIGPFGPANPGGGICIIPRSGADVIGTVTDAELLNGFFSLRSVAGSGSTVRVSVEDVTASGNNIGISSNGSGSNVAISNSTITANTTGVTHLNNGRVVSLGDNTMIWNSGDGSFTSTKAKK